MEDPASTAIITHALAEKHRVLMLGGLAVISHGLPRPTFDADIWLDPVLNPCAWASVVLTLCRMDPALHPVAIGSWTRISAEDLSAVIAEDGVVRIMGANQPLDIFRRPNELHIDEFENVWQRATPLADGTRLPDVIDILVTKLNTGRDKDLQDIAFLEAKAEREYLRTLPDADAAQAVWMLERFLTPRVAETALDHPAEPVRSLAELYLNEMADEGNPFARDILIKRNLA